MLTPTQKIVIKSKINKLIITNDGDFYDDDITVAHSNCTKDVCNK